MSDACSRRRPASASGSQTLHVHATDRFIPRSASALQGLGPGPGLELALEIFRSSIGLEPLELGLNCKLELAWRLGIDHDHEFGLVIKLQWPRA